MSIIKDPSEFGIDIPSKAYDLVNRFNSNILIKIKIASTIESQALKLSPPIITISKAFFEKRSGYTEQFTEDDIVVLVAHELGHLIPKSNFDTLLNLILKSMAISIFGIAYNCIIFSSSGLFIFCLITLVLFILLYPLTHNDEYRADKFAIVEADISTENFIQCFQKIAKTLQEELSFDSSWTVLQKIQKR